MAQIKEVAVIILQKTKEGKLQWSKLGNSVYGAGVGDNSITIDNRDRVYSLMVRNSEGDVVDRFDVPYRTGGDEEETLATVFELARRQALRVDETLEDVSRTLGRL